MLLFKQKTAYEMRISDWSSDVCSSDRLEWQVTSLIDCGVEDIVFLAGFNLPAVKRSLAHLARRWPSGRFRAVYNPFYGVADNLATCWLARHEMEGDFLLLNSDTLFSLPVLQALLASPAAPVSLAVDHKDRYDDDDMKVQLDGGRLLDIRSEEH